MEEQHSEVVDTETPGDAPDGARPPAETQPSQSRRGRGVSRRRFLVAGATSTASVGVVLASSALAQAQAQPTPSTAPASGQSTGAGASGGAANQNPGFEFFTPFQAAIVQAAAARLIPTDDNGPGATEAGVVYFIDRQLSSDYGLSGRRYEQGPWTAGASTQGDQSGLLMRDRYRLGTLGMEAYGQQLYQLSFVQLSDDQKDRILRDMQSGVPATFDGSSIQAATTGPSPSGTEAAFAQMTEGAPGVGATAFFNLLLSHTIAGFFADPVHGGNRGMVGWQLIGFPGAQMSYAANISQYGQPWTGGYKSLAEYQGLYLPS
jgi:gluconate 2-dehydrogenase gamma chain